MEKFRVSASSEYDIYIGSCIINNIGSYINDILPPCKICLITDSNVNSLYSQVVISSLMEAGFQTVKIVFPAGEHSKNLSTYTNIVSALAEEGITRSDSIISLGGGVVSDIAGFVASTYMRGISYIHIPTTLLSSIDASVSGKTSINLPNGKNLIGSFWQPSLVVCDTKLFETLDAHQLQDGMAEAVKSAVVSEASLLGHIYKNEIDYIVKRCISIRKSFVEADERDTGIRQLLNFGHTIGHAVEKLSSYNIPHGQAIATGMIIEARAAYRMGLTNTDISYDLSNIFSSIGFNTQLPSYDDTLYQLTLKDKKICNNNITVIVPEEIGKATLQKLPINMLKEYIISGTSYDRT